MPYPHYVPSQALESYQSLPAAFDMDSSLLEHAPRSQRAYHGHNHSGSRRPNYYSNVAMWVCCKCGDGPKVYKSQPACVMCHHVACSCCTEVK
ncbi:uncharacterized protein BDV17DRAFT_271400 [Aspergillus undulatus]|uniref:uncharacterized protein n=1 Tax=Aspergillus undulatus TaxID=1810928 RepID=UPI003CCCEA80